MMRHVAGRLVLDSWALMALFRGEQPAADTVSKMLLAAGDGTVTLWLNVINLGEIYYNICRADGEHKARRAIEKIRQLPIRIDPVDEGFVLQASEFKSQRPISYADAFAVASAVRLNAALVTGDPELLALADIVALEPLHRN